MGGKETCHFVSPILFNTMSSSSTCFAKNDRIVFFFMVGWRCIVWGEHVRSLHSSAGRYLPVVSIYCQLFLGKGAKTHNGGGTACSKPGAGKAGQAFVRHGKETELTGEENIHSEA